VEDISLHLLDIVENSIAARARNVGIRIADEADSGKLTVEIEDDGVGMDEATLERATDPFFTTRSTRRVGLGLSLLEQAAKETGGELKVESEPGKGTRVRATFFYGHIDCKPVGDIRETLRALAAGHPEVRLVFEYRNGSTFRFEAGGAAEGRRD